MYKNVDVEFKLLLFESTDICTLGSNYFNVYHLAKSSNSELKPMHTAAG